MGKSLFVKPRGTGYSSRIAFEDDDSKWTRRNVDFEQRKSNWFWRVPLLGQIAIVLFLTAVWLVLGTIAWLIAGGLGLIH
jgi:hypothetical protein